MADLVRGATGEDLAAELRLVLGRLGRLLRQHAVGGLSASQVSALASLERYGPLSMGRLSQLEAVSPPTMTRIVDWLEQHDLAERQSSDTDGRCTVVRITAAGRRALDRIRRDRTAFLAERLAELPAAESRRLVAALPALHRLAGDEE